MLNPIDRQDRKNNGFRNVLLVITHSRSQREVVDHLPI
jgi:hypothetical protein